MPVYFLRAQDGPVKIGFSAAPDIRRRELAKHSPVSLRLVRTVPGDVALERAFHRLFRQFRLHGEWFTWDESMLTETAKAIPAPVSRRLSGEPPEIIRARRLLDPSSETRGRRPKRNRKLTREGQRPLLIYFPAEVFASMRAKYGERGAAPAIRELVARDLGIKAAA